MEDTIPKAFFAYPSSRPILTEAIRDAVNELNAGRQVNIQIWEKCNIGGKFVINTICDAIDESELFFADLTGLNPNVMFELGYAIAHDKRIWLIFDTSYKKEKNMFNELKILSSIGYVSYSNSRHIVSGFYSNNPVEDIEKTIFKTAIEPNLKPGGYNSILYLKSLHENQAAMRVSQLLDKRLPSSIIFDDPSESIQSLKWYGTRVFGCNGLVCHFADPETEGADLQTARHALICGLAHGSGIPLLMLAENDFLAPIDYRDRLKHYRTVPDAIGYLEEWLPPVEQTLKVKQTAMEVQRAAKLATDLKNLHFGEHIAENETGDLTDQYFIPTAAYHAALKGRQTVFIGRKGSGKTANLIKLEDELSRRKQNVVCVIKPQRYQMLGIVDLLKQYQHRNVKAYAIESLWKFLLLTEIANTVYNSPPADQSNDVQERFFKFVEKNKELICKDFSIRLENCIQDLEGAIGKSKDKNPSLPVSEVLHSGILKQLRIELAQFLSKDQRVAILVDNLDKAWEQRNDIEVLSEILWGLLEVAQGLPMELQRQDSRRQRIQLNLSIFLRSDIFHKIRKVTPEPDKITCFSLKWDDKLLCRIIEERFLSTFKKILDPNVLWERYFCPTVNGIPIKEYITSAILKRPRDIIYFVNEAVRSAINKRHIRIEEEDIFEAELEYCLYALGIVNIENTLFDINLEDVILEFAEMPATLTKSEVIKVLELSKISEEMIEPTIKVLQDLTFLGLEVEENEFVFPDTLEESRKKEKLAEKFARRKGLEERLQIHKAFQAFLETKEPKLTPKRSTSVVHS